MKAKKLIAIVTMLLLLLASFPTYIFADNSTDITAEVTHERTVTVQTPVNGSVIVMAPVKIYAGDTISFTVTPDSGYKLESLKWYIADPSKATDITASKSFVMPDADVTVVAVFTKTSSGGGGSVTPAPKPKENSFVDIAKKDYFYDAVLWAAEKGITNGTDETHFSPNAPVTRAQVVTFLWRAAGCPVVDYWMNMSDVDTDAYYAEAVRWALSEGITKGTSAKTFSPDEVCTRAQIVTFIARFAGIDDDASGYTHQFKDVKTSDYFNNAVAWAAENKITEGTSKRKFSPNEDCLRGQTVTFLYRYFVK